MFEEIDFLRGEKAGGFQQAKLNRATVSASFAETVTRITDAWHMKLDY